MHEECIHGNVGTNHTDLIVGKLMLARVENIKQVSITADENIRSGFHGGSPYKCGICGKIFYRLHKMKEHYGVHDKTLKSIWTCKLCPRKENRRDHIYEHVIRKHKKLGGDADESVEKIRGSGWEKFSSEVDNFIDNLQPNTDSIETEDIIFCDFCEDIFHTNNSFKEHEKVHNPSLVNYSCNQCEDEFVVETIYKIHLMSHDVLYSKLNNGLLRCNVCSKQFLKKKELKTHVQYNHLKYLEKCHFCDFCPEFFITKRAIENHLLIHSENVFRCSYCKRRFQSKEGKETHQQKCRQKSNESAQCSECGLQLKRRSTLNGHMRKVHMKLYQYQCNECKRLYSCTDAVEKHLQAVHKICNPNEENFTFYTLEQAKLLNIAELNKIPAPRNKKSTTKKSPCPNGCGGYFKKSGFTTHFKTCKIPKSGAKFRCPENCGKVITRQGLTRHQKHCQGPLSSLPWEK